MGLSIVFGIPLPILRMFLVEYIPTSGVVIIPTLYGNVTSALVMSLIINLMPVIVMAIIFSHILGKYTDQSRITVLLEVTMFGAITAGGLAIVFGFLLTFTYIFGFFI
ncbi:MAG: hypothetical protein ACW981_20760 [Candidatus Hodarchaeales archaeon]